MASYKWSNTFVIAFKPKIVANSNIS